MKKYLFITVILVFISIYAFAQQDQNYQDYVRGMEDTWDEDSEARAFEEFKKQHDAAFQAFVLEQEEAYRKYVEEVERKWNEFIGSTKRQWVEYSEDKNVRSIVNFEEEETPEEKAQETKAEEKPDVKSEAESEVKPEDKPETEPEAETEAKSETRSEAETEETPKEKPDAKPEISEIKPQTSAEPKPEEKLEADPEEELEARPETKIEAKPEIEPETKSEEEPKAELEAAQETKTAEKPEVKPEIKPEKKPLTKPEEEKKGQITVEAVVEADKPDAVNKAKEMIAEHIEKIFSPENAAEKNVLEGQVKTKSGEIVTARSVRKFVQEEVLPRAKTAPERLKSKDGVERVKVSVVIPMVPRHLKIRAGHYLDLVRKYCRRYKEDLPLVMAVIQTESYFNPLAKSHIPAYGLMQIVPKYAGRDANKYVYKKDKEPEPKDLYVPENNLLLGVAYLRILREKYFYGIKDTTKQEYLMVASYNGGMGRVIRKVLKKYEVPKMTSSEVYEALRKEMPDETKDYLAKVTTRKKNYLAWQ